MVQGEVRIHLLETAVLFLQFLHTAQLLAVHPGIHLLPSVKGGLVDTQLPADVRSAFTRFMLLDRRNDLALADSCLFHCTVLSYEFSRFRQSEFSGGLQLLLIYSQLIIPKHVSVIRSMSTEHI